MTYIEYMYDGPIGLLKMVIAPFLDVFSYWFFAVIYFLFIGMLWIKNQDITLPVVLAMIIGAVMRLALPPEAHMVGYIFVGLGIAVILYRVVRSP